MSAAPASAARWELARVLLHRDARWMSPHLYRLGALVMLYLIAVLPAANSRTSAAPGLDLLQSLTICGVMWAIVVAEIQFASLMSDDWTGYNLELLRLTGMSAADLLWAKSIPQLGTGLSTLILSFPLALLAVTLGGVTIIQVTAIYVQLVVLFGLVVAVSLLAGALVKDATNAYTIAVVFVFGYSAVTLVADLFLFRSVVLPAKPTTPQWCLATEFFRILDSTFRGPIVSWPALLHVLTAVAALWSARLATAARWERAADHQPAEPVSEEQPKQPQPLWRPNDPPPRCTGNPVYWKDFYFTTGGEEMQLGKWLVLCLPICIVGTAGIGRLLSSQPELSDAVLAITAFFSIFAAIGVLTFTAQRLWQMEIQERTLGSLAILPWPPTDLVASKLWVLAVGSGPELTIFVVTIVGLMIYGLWLAAAGVAALLISLPIFVCTDAAWRFIPHTWEGLTSRGKVVGVPLAAWSQAGLLAYFTHPVVGLATLAICMPFVCWIVIDDCALRLAEHAGEIGDK